MRNRSRRRGSHRGRVGYACSRLWKRVQLSKSRCVCSTWLAAICVSSGTWRTPCLTGCCRVMRWTIAIRWWKPGNEANPMRCPEGASRILTRSSGFPPVAFGRRLRRRMRRAIWRCRSGSCIMCRWSAGVWSCCARLSRRCARAGSWQ